MKRKTTLLIALIICFIGVFLLVGCSSTKNEENLTEKTNTVENDAEASDPQVSTIRSELDSLLDLYGNDHTSPLSTSESFYLAFYDYPLFSSSSSDSDFSNQFDNYLIEVRELAILEERHDVLYESLIRSLVWDYDWYSEDLTEQQCEDIVSLIRLCEKQLETNAVPWPKDDNDTE